MTFPTSPVGGGHAESKLKSSLTFCLVGVHKQTLNPERKAVEIVTKGRVCKERNSQSPERESWGVRDGERESRKQ